MGTFLVYILKSAACLTVFYLFYKLLMSRDTFHRFNHFALLGLLVLSSVLPLIEVSVNRPAPVHETMLTLEQLLLLKVSGMPVTILIGRQDIIRCVEQGSSLVKFRYLEDKLKKICCE